MSEWSPGDRLVVSVRIWDLLYSLGVAYNGSCTTFLREWPEMPVWVPDRSNERANRAWFLGRCVRFGPAAPVVREGGGSDG